MAKNELLPFASGEDANVLPTNQWEALTDIIQNGFQSGIAKSEQVNRVLAQGAVASYVLGQLIVDELGKDATLDKDTLYQNLLKALQENAKDACLPINGSGAMTGYLGTYNGMFKMLDNAGYMKLIAGDGAYLNMYGTEHPDYAGWASLTGKSADGSTNYSLQVSNDGRCLFKGKEVERVNSSGLRYIRYESGLQICWDSGSLANGTQTATLTYPVAFANTEKQLVFVTSGTAKAIVTSGSRTATGFKVSSTLGDGGYSLVRNFSYVAIGYWK